MLPKEIRRVPGDDTGNNMKWDRLVLESELYTRTGNYSLLWNVRMQQGHFMEIADNPRDALAYYLMAFYSSLNGFDNIKHLKEAQIDNFSSWKSCAHVDVRIVNKISFLIEKCGLSSEEFRIFCKRTFVPASYQCHLFSIGECIEILSFAISGNVAEINSMIENSERRFISQFRKE